MLMETYWKRLKVYESKLSIISVWRSDAVSEGIPASVYVSKDSFGKADVRACASRGPLRVTYVTFGKNRRFKILLNKWVHV